MKTVTYYGSDDPNDNTIEHVIDGETLVLDTPTEVSEEVAKRAQEIEGHNFEVQSSEGSAFLQNTTKED